MRTTEISQLMTELNRFITQDGVDDREKEWALRQLDDPQLQAKVKLLSTTDIKIIAQLAQSEACHAKSLPRLTGLSQATISRCLTKLAKLALATKFRDLKNNKEILVRLTDSGQQVAELHRQLDAEIAKRAQVIAADYTPAELARFVSLMHRISEIKL